MLISICYENANTSKMKEDRSTKDHELGSDHLSFHRDIYLCIAGRTKIIFQ